MAEFEVSIPCRACGFGVQVRRGILQFGNAHGDVVCRRCGTTRPFLEALEETVEADFSLEKCLKPV